MMLTRTAHDVKDVVSRMSAEASVTGHFEVVKSYSLFINGFEHILREHFVSQ